MAIKGDLKDMSLPGLIQMICTEQRKAALLIRHNRVDEGALFFEGGEIVHARTGSLAGEEAVYHLLQWSEGTFQLLHSVRMVDIQETMRTECNKDIASRCSCA